MPIEIVVPDLGESVVEATVADWLKQEGDRVEAGEAIVVLETDKVDLDVGAEKSGVLTKIMRQSGDDVKIGDVLGMLDEAAEGTAPEPSEDESQAEEDAKPTEEPSTQEDALQTQEAAPVDEDEPMPDAKVTPVARRLADEHGIDLKQVEPASTHGRVTKEDVERYIATQGQAPERKPSASQPSAEPQPAAPAPQRATDEREERVRMSRRRRTIAQRLVEAQQTAAMLTTFNEVDMGAVMDLRARRKESFQEQYGVKLGLTSFFVKAAIGALKAFPRLNAEIDGNEIVLKHYYDIGVAIGAEEGLVVPVLRDADRMSFAAIETAVKDFVSKAQDGSLSLDDLRGGTFTITNGGVFGSLLSTPILNPPQVGILGLHKIEDRPVAKDGNVVIRPMMYVAVTYDHRIVDGREAVQFLVRLKDLIEDPEAMLLEG